MGIKKETEETFQKTVTDLAGLRGWLWYQTHNSECSVQGFPDLVMVRGDQIIYAELKMPGKSPTVAQVNWIEKLSWAGARVYLWRPEDWPGIQAVLAGHPDQTGRTVLAVHSAPTKPQADSAYLW